MYINKFQIHQLNNYFREFVVANTNYFHSDQKSDAFYMILKNETIPFNRSWDYLMIVVEIIESKWGEWGRTKIEMHNNVARFELGENKVFQNKGITKLEALYSCCFEALEELWKDKTPPFKYSSHEPFDEIDLA